MGYILAFIALFAVLAVLAKFYYITIPIGVIIIAVYVAVKIRKKKADQCRKEELVVIKANREKEFINKLNEIPKYNISLSNQKIKNNFALEMEDLKTKKPRKGTKRSSYGNFVVIDTETTGISLKESIVEVSAIKFENFEPISAFDTLIDPEKSIPIEATNVNNITDEMVKGKPRIKQVIPSLKEFVGSDVIIGHNLQFDIKFLYKYGCDFSDVPSRKYYDTLEIARAKVPKHSEKTYDGIDNYKLSTLCEYYDIPISNAHRSLADCYATGLLFSNLIDEYELE